MVIDIKSGQTANEHSDLVQPREVHVLLSWFDSA